MTSWITDNLIKGVDGLAFGVLLFVIVVGGGTITLVAFMGAALLAAPVRHGSQG